MTMTRSLSDFWRCDHSDDSVSELASVLQRADILIGNMGSDIRQRMDTRTPLQERSNAVAA